MIPFIDLQAQRARIADKIDAAVSKVIKSGAYIFGPEVKTLEAQLAAFAQTKHCIGNANGTDALVLPLWAWGIGEGDAVFCPSFTFAATAESPTGSAANGPSAPDANARFVAVGAML